MSCRVYNLFLLPPNGEENNHCRFKPGVQEIKISVHYIQVLAKQHTTLIKHYSLITAREISILQYSGVFKSGVCGKFPALAP